MVTPTPTTVQVKIQLRSDTSANWASVNPVLLAGEMGLETNTNRIKIGNGSTAWNSLGYFPFAVSGGTVTGNLEIGTTGTLTFEGSSADNFETTLGVINPTADRTINLPNVSGTIITTGDTGTVTSTMIADGTIVNADVSASAAIAHSKLATITAGYVLIGNASNVPTATQVTGDVTIGDTGVTAISSGVIVDADIAANAEIAVSKLANGTANQVIVTDGTNVSWSDDLTLAGNLTVNGTTTTINTQDLLVEDKNIILGNVDTPTDVTADGGGITLKGATDKTINWVDATDAWTSSEHIELASGKSYRINGAEVLNATTLGSGVTSSSLTSVGTLGSLTVTNDATAGTFIPTSGTAPSNGLYLPAANSVALSTSGVGRVFIDANGNVGVNDAAGDNLFDVYDKNIRANRYGAPASFVLHTAGGSLSAPTAIVSSSQIGTIISRAYDGSAYRDVGKIFFESDGAVSSTSSPGFIRFFTTPSGSTTSQERLRITSAGLVGIGTSAPGALLDARGSGVVCNIGTASHFTQIGTFGTGTTERPFLRLTDGAGGYYVSLGGKSSGGTTTTSYFLGSVGIGTTSPTSHNSIDRVLNIDGANGTKSGISLSEAGANYFDIYFDGSNNTAHIDQSASGGLIFTSGSSEAFRVDSSGRLLVGTSSARSSYARLVNIEATSDAESGLTLTANTTSAGSGPVLSLGRTRGASGGTNTIVQSGDTLGYLTFNGSDGNDLANYAAWITCQVDGTPGANDMPGRLVFSTTADGASSPTPRMLIKSTGLMELTSSAGNNGFGLFHIYNSTVRSGTEKDSMMRVTRTGALGTSYDCVAALSMGRYSTAGSNGYTELILQMNDGATTALDSTPLKIRASGEVRFVSAPTTASAANAFLDSANENRLLRSTSSLRYKTDIENIEHQRADAILNFRPVWYRSIAGSDRSDWSWYGLIAEEVAAIEPRLVHWTYLDDAYNITYETVENEDGTTVEVEKDRTLKPDAEQVPDGVQYDRLTVLLLDVVKRQQQTIADLEARVAALESA